MSSNTGRPTSPPSHPHAATIAAKPLARPSRRKSRRDSVMNREPSSIRPAGHGAQRRRIDNEDENHVHNEKRGEKPHRPEMPVARRLKSAEQRGKPGELRRFVDRKAGQHRQDAEENDR